MAKDAADVPAGPVTRLCLHGVGVRAELRMIPPILRFGRALVGESVSRVLCINNPCDIPAVFRYKKLAYFHVDPVEGILKAHESVEVEVVAKASALGDINTKLSFDILSEECLTASTSKLSVIGLAQVKVVFSTRAAQTIPKVKFLPGITPKVAHEVGQFTDQVTFDMEVPKPRAAMVCARWDRTVHPHKQEHNHECVPGSKNHTNCQTHLKYSSAGIDHEPLIRTEQDAAGDLCEELSDNLDGDASQVAMSTIWTPERLPRILGIFKGEVTITEVNYTASPVKKRVEAKPGIQHGPMSVIADVSKSISKLNTKKYSKARNERKEPMRTSDKPKATVSQFQSDFSIPVDFTGLNKSESLHQLPLRVTIGATICPSKTTSRMIMKKESSTIQRDLNKPARSEHSVSTVDGQPRDKSSLSIQEPLTQESQLPHSSASRSSRKNINMSPSKVSGCTGSKSILDDASCTPDALKDGAQGPLSKKRGTHCITDPRAIIAFPNDRRRTLRTEMKGTVRTIFAGLPRYVPPLDPQYQYTEEELFAKQKHERRYLDYMRATARGITAKQLAPLPPMFEDYLQLTPKTKNFATEKFVSVLNKMPMEEDEDVVPENLTFDVPLSPTELYNVRIWPPVINFGKVAPDSCIYQMQVLENMNPFSVHIRAKSLSQLFSFPEDDSRIVGPMQCVLQTVLYRATATGSGTHTGVLEYVINGSHSFEVTAMAENVLKKLLVTPLELKFGDTKPDLAFQPQFLTAEVYNPLPTGISFSWEVPENSCFSVFPRTGLVPAQQRVACTVTYEPEPGKQRTSELILQSEGGIFQKIKCKTLAFDAALSFMEPKLVVGQVPINSENSYVAVLCNYGYRKVLFRVRNPEPVSGCIVTPRIGVINARSCMMLNVQFQFTFVAEFCFPVYVEFEGCVKPAEIRVCGETALPLITVKPDCVRMPRVSVDSVGSQAITIQNEGYILGVVEFDLLNYPEFCISLSPHPYSKGKISRIIVNPWQHQTLYLHFKPVDAASYNFCLPIVVNGIVGPAELDNPETHCLEGHLDNAQTRAAEFEMYRELTVPVEYQTVPMTHVDCTVAGRCLSISKTKFQFVYLPGDHSTSKLEENFSITNLGNKTANFTIQCHAADSSPFSLTWISGVPMLKEKAALLCRLKPNEFVCLHISFQPDDPGRYETRMAMFVAGYGYGSVYNYLHMEGNSPFPLLKSEISELYFLPTPLRIWSTKRFILEAMYHEHSVEVEADVLPEKDNGVCTDSIDVVFPYGSTVPEGRSVFKVVVEVLFRSVVPISLCAKIKFSTPAGALWVVHVTASADMCLLTNHACVHTKSLELWPPEEEDEDDSYVSIAKEVSLGTAEDPYLRKRDSRYFSIESTLRLLSRRSDGTTASLFPSTGLSTADQRQYSITAMSAAESGIGDGFKTDEVVFPKFPEDGDVSYYADHMRQTLRAAETWLYEQGFNCRYAPIIPSGMYVDTNELPWVNGQTSAKFRMLSVLDLLESLAGTTVTEFFSKKSSQQPTDSASRIARLVALHKQLLLFLKQQGALLGHISPDIMLTYPDYLLFVASAKRRKRTTISHNLYEDGSSHYDVKEEEFLHEHGKEDFILLTKQAWLDVTLQIFKVLVLSRVTMDSATQLRRWPGEFAKTDGISLSRSTPSLASTSETSQRTDSDEQDFTEAETSTAKNEKNEMSWEKELRECLDSIQSNLINTDIYSEGEHILLAWLSVHFEQQRYLLHAPKRFVLNFDTDLSDGLVLAAVTVAYTEYLRDAFFTDLYSMPETPEQAHHNAARVVGAWNTMNLGYSITPANITAPNSVNMLMLVTFLYETLPTYVPRVVLTFDTCLTGTSSRRIHLTNPSSNVITFSAVFYGDLNGYFSLERPSTITIPPHQDCEFGIRFTARRIAKVRAVLVLCGATTAPTFTSNLAFFLEGDATELAVTTTYTISMSLYAPTYLTLFIRPPYTTPANYDIWVTGKEPTNTESFQATKWADIWMRKVPRRMFLSKTVLALEEGNTRAPLSLTLSCMSTNTRTYWLVFRHAQVGDFLVKIVVSPRICDRMATIRYVVPTDHFKMRCSCSATDLHSIGAFNCPLRRALPIPNRNPQLWDCVREMFFKTLDTTEVSFWTKHLETDIGLRLIKWMLGKERDIVSEEFTHIFQSAVTYSVTCSNTAYVRVPKTFRIEDVRAPVTTPMPIHVSSSANVPAEFTIGMTLTSEDKKEVRNYKVKFSVI